jgi:serine/threonine-protein kinase
MPITPTERRKLVEVLLQCATISDYDKRTILIADMDAAISSRVNDNRATVFHVTELVKTCAEYDGGLDQLLEVLAFYEQGSIAMRQVQQTWDGLVAQRQPKIVVPPVIPPRPKIEFDWVTIPAGKFLMGSDDGRDDEKPAHEVYLPEYYAARVPTTNEQWVAFLRDSDYAWKRLAKWWQWIHQDKYDEKIHIGGKASSLVIPSGKEKHPVVYVTWHDAVAFCEWATNLIPCPSPTGKGSIRLPTEAEWEKAARGRDGRNYPWGNNPPNDKLCNFNRNVGYTTAVGSYHDGESPYRVLDMAGNVWEWCSSDYKEYPYNADDGRENLSINKYKVLRGGSWFNGSYNLRCACRASHNPYDLNNFRGFRCFFVPIF